jgi:2-keto-3-deoxy-L-rhamnonate aldolase RhmA
MPALRDVEPALGLWSVTADPRVLEVAASANPDFVAIDTQHGVHIASLGIESFSVLSEQGVPAIVRVESHQPAVIGRALDLGASGIMAPQVDDAEQARAVVAATRYGPAGKRSYGMQTTRIDPLAADYRPLVAIQIESTTAVMNAEEIAAVEGVDWLYVGPADLGLSFGGTPASDVIAVFDGSHPLASEMQEAFKAVVEAATRHGKKAGLHCSSGAAGQRLLDFGFTVSAVATDLAVAGHGVAEQLRIARVVSRNRRRPPRGAASAAPYG